MSSFAVGGRKATCPTVGLLLASGHASDRPPHGPNGVRGERRARQADDQAFVDQTIDGQTNDDQTHGQATVRHVRLF